jgi:hypothetical protein
MTRGSVKFITFGSELDISFWDMWQVADGPSTRPQMRRISLPELVNWQNQFHIMFGIYCFVKQHGPDRPPHINCTTNPNFCSDICNFDSTCNNLSKSRESSVGIATGYGLDDQGVGVRVPVGVRICTSPCRPDRLWGPSNLVSNGYRGLFPLG